MPNNVTEAHRYNITLSYNNNGVNTKIDPNFIRYLVIENLYHERNLPVIYMSLSVNTDLYKNIHDNEATGKFILKIDRFNIFSNLPLYQDSINGDFSYVMSNNNPENMEDLSGAPDNANDNYKIITVGLLSMSLMNASRAQKDTRNGILVSGMLGKIDSNTLINCVFEGLSDYHLYTAIKIPTHNIEYESINIPVMNSRAEILNYFYDKDPFYDTLFTFFIDFGRAYLLDQVPGGMQINDNTDHNILFKIGKVTDPNSYSEGMTSSNGMTIVHVNPNDVIATPNKGQDKVSNKLVTIDEKFTVDSVDLDINKTEGSDPKYLFKRGGNAMLYKNIMESNTVNITLAKSNLDSMIFTPNKRYEINYATDSDNKKYNGEYLLASKREIIRNEAGMFRGSCEFRFRKLGNIENINPIENKNAATLNTNAEVSTQYTVGSSRNSATDNVNAKYIKTNTNKGKKFIPVNKVTNSPRLLKRTAAPVYDKPLSELSVEEQIAMCEKNAIPRIHGNELNSDNAGPVQVIKDKYNKISLNKQIK